MTAVTKTEFKKYLSELDAYLAEWYSPEKPVFLFESSYSLDDADFPCIDGFSKDSGLDKYIFNLDSSFGEKTRRFASGKKIRQSEIINLTGISKSTFYRMLSGETHPAKDHCVEIALVLKLTSDEASDLLQSAGYALSRSNARDMAIRYFFENRIYDMTLINMLFDSKGMALLGNVIE